VLAGCSTANQGRIPRFEVTPRLGRCQSIGTTLVRTTLEGTTGEGEERFVPHGIRHLKLSKRQNSDPLSGSGPTFWSALRKDSDSDTDSAVSFNRSTVVSNPDDYIFVQKAKAFGVPSSCRGLLDCGRRPHTNCTSRRVRHRSTGSTRSSASLLLSNSLPLAAIIPCGSKRPQGWPR